MKIISGYLKNKKIILPSDKSTRPLKSLVRESIFNIIEHSKIFNLKIKDSDVLDLFSGIGSFGLESISRGAKKVIFCENYKPSLKILKKNIFNLNCSENGVISPLVGIIGTTQAMEAIKAITGIGQSLIGKVAYYDAKQNEWQKFSLAKSANCPICST